MSRRQLPLWAVAGCMVSASAAMAQLNPSPCPTNGQGQVINPPPPGTSIGPDVLVGDMQDAQYWGVVNNIRAYSFGTTSCNLGTQNVRWIAGTREHPAIGQNMYRILNGRFEQIGQSWLKHGFTALTGSICCTCTGVGGSQLGIGCSDPYTAQRNGSQTGCGPKYGVNANTGFFPYPFSASNTNLGYTAPPNPAATIGRRLQVATADIDQGPAGGPNPNAGATYLIDAHYVTRDDAEAGNGLNNLTARRVQFAVGTNNISFASSVTRRGVPAIVAWHDLDASVTLVSYDYHETNTVPIPVAGEAATQNLVARYWVAAKVVTNGDGTYTYNYAVMNVNSDRSVMSFNVPAGCNSSVSNLYFRAPLYHSGEPFDNSPWTPTVDSTGIHWSSGKNYAADHYANALRWGTTYTFSFTSRQAPTTGSVTMDYYKPGLAGGDPSSFQVDGIPVPTTNSCPAERDGFAGITPTDVAAFVNSWFSDVSSGTHNADFDCSGNTDPVDIANYVNSWLSAVNAGGC